MIRKPKAIRLIQQRAGWSDPEMELLLLRFIEFKGQLTQLESFLEMEAEIEDEVDQDEEVSLQDEIAADDAIWDALNDEEELNREPEEE